MQSTTPHFFTHCILIVNYRLPRRQRVFPYSVASTAARDSVQIGRLIFFNGGLHVDFEGLQWPRVVEIQKAQKSKRKKEQLSVCAALEDSFISPLIITHQHSSSLLTPHTRRQPAKLSLAPGEVGGGSGAAGSSRSLQK